MGRTMHTPQRTLDDRFEAAGEGFLFLLIAALALPSGMTAYAAVAGVGVLLLGLNAARAITGIRVRWFSITVGTWAVIGGLGAMAGLRIDAFALFFLLLGLVTLGAAALMSVTGAERRRTPCAVVDGAELRSSSRRGHP
jgi:hypothetical protein